MAVAGLRHVKWKGVIPDAEGDPGPARCNYRNCPGHSTASVAQPLIRPIARRETGVSRRPIGHLLPASSGEKGSTALLRLLLKRKALIA